MGGMKALLGDQSPPFSHKSDTSKAAAESMKAPAGSIRARVLRSLREFGGSTIEELSMKLDVRIQTVCGRVKELESYGYIKDSGLRRKTSSGRTAKVWVAT